MMRGVTLKVVSVMFFAFMGALIKYVCKDYPIGEVVFFRSFFALPALFVWLATQHQFPQALRTDRPLGHFGRGTISAVGMISSFSALSLLPLADATAFGFITPLIVIVLAALVLGEKIRAYRWSAVLIGFIGVIIMLSDHLGVGAEAPSGQTKAGAAIALGGTLFAAAATIQTRRLTQTENTGAIVFYLFVFTSTLGALSYFLSDMRVYGVGGEPLFIVQHWVMPTLFEAALLIAIGTSGGIGHILMTESYRYADASVVASFDYSAMLWALVIGYFAFGDRPTASVLIGAGIVISADIFVIWREGALGLRRAERTVASATRPT